MSKPNTNPFQITDASPIPFPQAQPHEFPLEFPEEKEPVYNPQIHLSEFVLNDGQVNVHQLDTYEEFEQIPPPESNANSNLAFSQSFQVLSPEGVRTLRGILDDLKQYAKHHGRQPCANRHQGYRSRFIRDFNRCTILHRFLSKLAGHEITAHSMVSHYSHTNYGIVGDGRAVDQWHVDSVPFVVVILMSDMTDAEGGILEVIKAPQEPAWRMLHETKNNVPQEHLLQVNYPGMGWGIFMQGSRMVHHVTKVSNAREPRITVVNSYMSVNPFVPDSTKYITYSNESTVNFEYARHKAWRASQQLQALVDSKDWKTNQEIVTNLQDSISELVTAAKYVSGVDTDVLHHFDENNDELDNLSSTKRGRRKVMKNERAAL